MCFALISAVVWMYFSSYTEHDTELSLCLAHFRCAKLDSPANWEHVGLLCYLLSYCLIFTLYLFIYLAQIARIYGLNSNSDIWFFLYYYYYFFSTLHISHTAQFLCCLGQLLFLALGNGNGLHIALSACLCACSWAHIRAQPKLPWQTRFWRERRGGFYCVLKGCVEFRARSKPVFGCGVHLWVKPRGC